VLGGGGVGGTLEGVEERVEGGGGGGGAVLVGGKGSEDS